ncbi:hypothetical protein [Sediminicoccus rosea]|uniref:NADH:quinone oxidoreductase/Mrp antiporter membrane subunit domain-containing protein n=1 Tax=Sediminicoccus rosea TaxID=1225128 RepID=A0ABZ0PD13_9PROT|nr:hypothetical protein [Sediminicoccus rosea]WPB83461.1 hypothetical protein R9Z33_15270 [Sediminicoccus rosea]
MEAGLAPALLEASALAARSALLGGAAFLLAVASPLARRLPAGQAATLMAATQLFLRLAALATMALAVAQLVAGQFGAVGVLLAAAVPLVLAPREGPAPRLALVILGFAALVMVLGVTEGRLSLLQPGSVTLATLLREAGAALWMGNLPLLWMLLRPNWPASVPQAIGIRHAGLMLAGMALVAAGLFVAAPHRTLLFGPEALPLLAVTAGFVLLAQLAAGLRVLLLLAAGRAAPAGLWLPRLRCVVEIELLLSLVLCGPIVALFRLGAQGLEPAATPDLAALVPRFGLHALGPAETGGLVLLLIALLAWLNRLGGAPLARFAPLLLLPLGLGLAWGAQGVALALALLVIVAGLAEAWVVFRGSAGGPGMVLPFAVILGVILVLAGAPPRWALLPCFLATLALLIRWAELRLPDRRDGAAMALAWPVVLGALGLVLVLAHDS